MADPYISEVKYLGGKTQDFIEIAVDAGTDVSLIEVVVYNSNGDVRSTNLLVTKVATISGKDIYVTDTATSATFNGLHKFGAVALVDDGVVLEFISFSDNAGTVTANGGPADGLTSTDIGQAGAGESLETDHGGGAFSVQTNPSSGSIPCFTTGTMILTPRGERPVETLKIGDLVVTEDRGLQPVRWIGSRDISPEMVKDSSFCPVRISAHSFGKGLPVRDLYVSPNHRILLDTPHCALLFAENEVLSAAKYLTDHKAISAAAPKRPFAYVHVLFSNHEIIWSDGLPTESFHPGQEGLNGFAPDTRAEVLSLFPGLQSCLAAYGPTARMDLRKFEAGVVGERLNQTA